MAKVVENQLKQRFDGNELLQASVMEFFDA